MANNFMMKLLLLFFGYLNFYGAVAQISKKSDVASSAVQPGRYQASTLLTSIINKADINLHEVDTPNAQTEFDANYNDLADMNDNEVLTDTEDNDDDDDDDDDDDEQHPSVLADVNNPNSANFAMSSADNQFKGGKGVRARLVRYKKADCEKKRTGKGKRMRESKCHTLHRKHFNSYEFILRESKKGKKDKDDDESEDDSSKGCRVVIYHDGKCTDEASSANEESCTDIGDEDGDDKEDKDDKDDKKLHARDLMSERPKYKSAKFLCDGVNAGDPTSTESESDYYSTTSLYSDRYADPTGSSSKAFTLPSKTATPLSSKSESGEPTTTDAPDPDDDEQDPDDDDDEEDDDDVDDDDDGKEDSPKPKTTKTIKTKKHKTKSHKSKKTKSKKHHSKTQSIVTTTEAVPTTSDGPDTEWS
ncbi:unnamed protein product [Aureobasidium uvarum]|uniref:Uncharacterized protein n=1 Tax=Aureobasidium uvarum TaxID=2773716 RepID=A0A9N8KBB7_9PEZI|nr:unnamed protein product [Aureobasidium uvarum]